MRVHLRAEFQPTPRRNGSRPWIEPLGDILVASPTSSRRRAGVALGQSGLILSRALPEADTFDSRSFGEPTVSTATAVRVRAKSLWRSKWVWIVFCLGFVVLCTGAYTGLLGSNFRVVEAGRFYRSGILNRDELERVIRTNEIRTVINLCGSQPSKQWYRDEVEFCEQARVAHFDLRLAGGREPSKRRVLELLALFDGAPTPMLVHCGSGADRAGFASAVFRIVESNARPSEAISDQLSVRYGHVGILNGRGVEQFFERFESEANGKTLREWLSGFEHDSAPEDKVGESSNRADHGGVSVPDPGDSRD